MVTMTPRTIPPLERFQTKYLIADSCWLWTAFTTSNGYGQFWSGERLMYAHRWSYEHFVGSIPDDRELDHLCRNTACVNPEHLEPVTHAENIYRGYQAKPRLKFCKRGHSYAETEVLYNNGRRRYCRLCRMARDEEKKLESAGV